jgi:hypothetical protein
MECNMAEFVTGVDLKIKDVTLKLTVEEARQMYNELCALFGPKVTWMYPWHYPTTVYSSSEPYITWTTCDNVTSATASSEFAT